MLVLVVLDVVGGGFVVVVVGAVVVGAVVGVDDWETVCDWTDAESEGPVAVILYVWVAPLQANGTVSAPLGPV